MKRGRSEPTWNRRILQAWVRMVIKAVIIIGQAIEHRVLAHLKMPKPRGVMARQILEMAARMETDQLDRLVGQMGDILQERALHDATPPESEWSKVSSQTPRRSVSETPLTPPRPSSEIPQTPEYRQPSMWEVPPTVEVNKAPICRCGDRATIFISKTARNPDRLFWRCPRGRGKQCSFFQWLEDQSFRDVQPQSMEYIRKRMQEECPHRITTRAGSNAFFDQTTAGNYFARRGRADHQRLQHRQRHLPHQPTAHHRQ